MCNTHLKQTQMYVLMKTDQNTEMLKLVMLYKDYKRLKAISLGIYFCHDYSEQAVTVFPVYCIWKTWLLSIVRQTAMPSSSSSCYKRNKGWQSHTGMQLIWPPSELFLMKWKHKGWKAKRTGTNSSNAVILHFKLKTHDFIFQSGSYLFISP